MKISVQSTSPMSGVLRRPPAVEGADNTERGPRVQDVMNSRSSVVLAFWTCLS